MKRHGRSAAALVTKPSVDGRPRPALQFASGITEDGASRREVVMRRVTLALLGFTATALLGSGPAAAVGTRYPFCIQGNEYPGLSNCTFTSYQQCQATASGRQLYCLENPYFQGGAEFQDSRRTRRRDSRY
jgi:hypothetical protein